MSSGIFIVLGLIVVIGIIKLAMMWKFAPANAIEPSGDEASPMTNRRALEYAVGLIALVFLTFSYADMNLWFLPIVAYVAVWTPQVARKTATPRQAIYVGAAFGAAMVVAVLLQVLM
jgi:hypothetical protein